MNDRNSKLTEDDMQTWLTYIDSIGKYHMPYYLFVPNRDIVSSSATTITSRKLDLHGKILHVAWGMFNEFIDLHHTCDNGSVVVITGKSGKIAEEFPSWCKNNPKIKRYEGLTNSDGRSGSYRIYLRKP
jgi:hypothetical protein